MHNDLRSITWGAIGYLRIAKHRTMCGGWRRRRCRNPTSPLTSRYCVFVVVEQDVRAKLKVALLRRLVDRATRMASAPTVAGTHTVMYLLYPAAMIAEAGCCRALDGFLVQKHAMTAQVAQKAHKPSHLVAWRVAVRSKVRQHDTSLQKQKAPEQGGLPAQLNQ